MDELSLQRILLRWDVCSGPLLLPFSQSRTQYRLIFRRSVLGNIKSALLRDERVIALQRIAKEKVNCRRIVSAAQRKGRSHTKSVSIQRNARFQEFEPTLRVV